MWVVTTTSPKKSDLGVRTLSAIVMVAVAGTALFLGGRWWTVFVVAVGLGVLWEWSALAARIAKRGLDAVLWGLAAVIYIGIAVIVLAILGEGAIIPVTVVVAVDVGAYFAGRTFGGPKIAPSISPSKTWSGLVGGAIGASLTLVVWYGLYTDAPADLMIGRFPQATLSDWPILVGVGVICAIVAQAGDFFESWMKRRAGVKDSGSLIPGHGGLFDRTDGLLAVCFGLGVLMLVRGIL